MQPVPRTSGLPHKYVQMPAGPGTSSLPQKPPMPQQTLAGPEKHLEVTTQQVRQQLCLNEGLTGSYSVLL